MGIAVLLLGRLVVASSTEISELMAGFGVRPVSPPSPAVDFTLPLIDGSPASLSDYQGQWVLLTFLATWCGPCRAELPSLEQLYRQRSGAGLTVLGISVDRDPQVVAPFVEELDVTFPIMWDEEGEIGIAYRASSIPLTYLVDPFGRIVGVSYGARDWGSLMPLLGTILEAVPPAHVSDAQYAASGPVALPVTMDPPTAEIALSNPQPEVEETFYLDIDLQWAGDLEEYLPQPPRVGLPEGIERTGVTAATSSRQGRHVVAYRVTLVAHEEGRFALDPVEIRYTSRFASAPSESRMQGPTVEVTPATIAGVPARTLLFATVSLLLAVGAAYGVWAWRRGRNAQSVSVMPYERLREKFESARGLRLQGNEAGFLLALTDIEKELGELGHMSEGRWPEVVERVRYGGQVPPREELDRLERMVARRLEEIRPDQKAAALEELQFKT